MITLTSGLRRVATYERVSSEDQRERETIKTQTDALELRLSAEDVQIVARYSDDGVSGMRALSDRPGGAQLLRDAAAHAFDELWLYRTDRLGRNLADMAATGQRLEALGITVMSVVEGRMEPFLFDLMAVLAQNERRTFRRRSRDGVERAAAEGRYVGGIVPLGDRVVGEKGKARLQPDTATLWADTSAADVLRQLYAWVGLEGWSCAHVARELNARGVPTHYRRDGRLVGPKGQRRERTQGLWRAGRIRNLIVSPIYRGEASFGKRSATRDRNVITASVEALVSVELWAAAQATLARNRLMPKNSTTVNLLRGTIRCGVDGLAYTSSHGHGGAYYRCDGKFLGRGPLEGRCPSRYVPAAWLEALVWADVQHWLRDPGDALHDLDAGREREAASAAAGAQSSSLALALQATSERRARTVDLCVSGLIDKADLATRLETLDTERVAIEGRIAALIPSEDDPRPDLPPDQLEQIRQHLDGGLTPEERHEIVRLLVSVVVEMDGRPDDAKRARVVIRYRFPGVVSTRSGTGSSRRSSAQERRQECAAAPRSWPPFAALSPGR